MDLQLIGAFSSRLTEPHNSLRDFSLRDFAGSSMGSLGSLFLQNAHGYSLQQTGVTLSGIKS